MFNLGLDLDGCLDDHNNFFVNLINGWFGKIFIITFRDDYKKTENYLRSLGINYDELILVNSFEEKAEVIKQKNIKFYFDDQPEIIKFIPQEVSVFLVRNEGNFDYSNQKWVMSEKTAQLI